MRLRLPLRLPLRARVRVHGGWLLCRRLCFGCLLLCGRRAPRRRRGAALKQKPPAAVAHCSVVGFPVVLHSVCTSVVYTLCSGAAAGAAAAGQMAAALLSRWAWRALSLSLFSPRPPGPRHALQGMRGAGVGVGEGVGTRRARGARLFWAPRRPRQAGRQAEAVGRPHSTGPSHVPAAAPRSLALPFHPAPRAGGQAGRRARAGRTDGD